MALFDFRLACWTPVRYELLVARLAEDLRAPLRPDARPLLVADEEQLGGSIASRARVEGHTPAVPMQIALANALMERACAFRVRVAESASRARVESREDVGLREAIRRRECDPVAPHDVLRLRYLGQVGNATEWLCDECPDAVRRKPVRIAHVVQHRVSEQRDVKRRRYRG